jgi:hypothetical protein
VFNVGFEVVSHKRKAPTFRKSRPKLVAPSSRSGDACRREEKREQSARGQMNILIRVQTKKKGPDNAQSRPKFACRRPVMRGRAIAVSDAPRVQELSDVAAALVGCGHVSGLLMRRMCRWP